MTEDPWALLTKLPERGWITLRTDQRLALLQLQASGLVSVQTATPGLYDVRLTAAGRLTRASIVLAPDPTVPAAAGAAPASSTPSGGGA